MPYAKKCKQERLTYEEALSVAKEAGVVLAIDGRGFIGALAAVPYFGRPDESIIPGI
jgi:tRNA(Ile2) C34 agmatinyltransferase TiaS